MPRSVMTVPVYVLAEVGEETGWPAPLVLGAPAPDLAITCVDLAKLLAQNAEMGALPVLYAATAPEVESGQLIGPNARNESKGFPTVVFMRFFGGGV